MGIQSGTFNMDAIITYTPAAANITANQQIPIVSSLIAEGMTAGNTHSFRFTKPSFTAVYFSEGYRHYLKLWWQLTKYIRHKLN